MNDTMFFRTFLILFLTSSKIYLGNYLRSV